MEVLAISAWGRAHSEEGVAPEDSEFPLVDWPGEDAGRPTAPPVAVCVAEADQPGTAARADSMEFCQGVVGRPISRLSLWPSS